MTSVPKLSRREFLAATAAVGVAIPGASSAMARELSVVAGAEIVDTHVYLGRWPFERLACEGPAELAELLRERRVARAWVGTFEGLLHKDIGGANIRLFEDCRRRERLVPLGSVNPTLPDWEEDVRRCHELFKMPGIRLYPNYHGYTLADERFSRLLEVATARGLLVQVVAWLGDGKHPYFNLPAVDVDLAPLAEQVKRFPGIRLVVSNGFHSADAKQHAKLAAAGVCFGLAGMQTDDGGGELSEMFPRDRLVFGSGAPLGDFQGARERVEALSLSGEELDAVCQGTASRLMR